MWRLIFRTKTRTREASGLFLFFQVDIVDLQLEESYRHCQCGWCGVDGCKEDEEVCPTVQEAVCVCLTGGEEGGFLSVWLWMYGCCCEFQGNAGG